ncbi:MAG: hypothetical protein CMC55_08570 [Flavobacteriaceae bacterium]|nr:hypothetical protein [Flavobacteriaceae bacterium]
MILNNNQLLFLHDVLKQTSQFNLDYYQYACHSRDYKDLINDFGGEYIGGGHFSVVFKHKIIPDYLIKVNLREDPGYMLWAKHCQQYTHPMYPEIPYMDTIGNRSLYLLKPYEQISCIDWDKKDMYKMFWRALNNEPETLFKEFDIKDNPFELFNKRYKHEGFEEDITFNNVMWNPVTKMPVLTDPICLFGEEH